jgi:hypothetical protein
MPSTEAARRDDAADAYGAELAAFLERSVSTHGREAVAQAFHAVRNMAYHSGPDRTALAALRSGRGACTAKHILLRDLLRLLGETADVEIVQGDFARDMPVSPDMGDELRAAVEAAGVTDFHCRVIWNDGGREKVLDATWPDSVASFGIPVNAGWDGSGDSRSAIADVTSMGRHEDVIARKEELLASLPATVRERRRAFLTLLSRWLEVSVR